jgi:hypothetical protein
MNWDTSDLPNAWRKFKEHVQFVFGGPLKAKDEATQCNYLMIWVGEKGRDLYCTWELSEDEKKLLASYYTKFEEYCKPRSSQLLTRYMLNKRKQGPAESVVDFVKDLKILVRDTGKDKQDEEVRDAMVFGTNSEKVRGKMLDVGDELSLKDAETIARLHEVTQQQNVIMSGEDPTVSKASVDALHKGRAPGMRGKWPRSQGASGGRKAHQDMNVDTAAVIIAVIKPAQRRANHATTARRWVTFQQCVDKNNHKESKTQGVPTQKRKYTHLRIQKMIRIVRDCSLEHCS